MPYTIEREDAAEDARVLRAAIRVASGFVPEDAEAMRRLAELADSIEEQVKPAIEEPTEFGSIVRAGYEAHTDRVLWVRTYSGWFAETQHGFHAYFAGLHDPEVLRVGIGEAPNDAYSRGYEEGVESNLPSPVDRSVIHSAIRDELDAICARDGLAYIEEDSDVITDAVVKAMEPAIRTDVAPEETSDYMYGVRDTVTAAVYKLRRLRADALTAERQNAYDKAIAAVEATS